MREKYCGVVYRQLDEIKADLVTEFDFISTLLRRHAIPDDDDDSTDPIDYTLEALQDALDLHSKSQETFMSRKAAITKIFSSKMLSGKTRILRNLRAEAREMSGKSFNSSPSCHAYIRFGRR